MRSMLLVCVLAACTLCTVACGRHGGGGPGGAATELSAADARRALVDRAWIDRLPQSPRDKIAVLHFVGGGKLGVTQSRTLFKGTFELLLYSVEGNRLTMTFPDSDEKVTVGFRVRRVEGPPPFDLELTLDRNPRGPRKYYSVARQRSLDAYGLELPGLPSLP